jgi:hypothetical protein
MPPMLVEAKIKGLHEDYIFLDVTIFLQNLLYLGYLLVVRVFTAMALANFPDNVAQVMKGFIKGMSLATLLAWTVHRMVPSESFGGLTNTTGMYGLVGQVMRSLRARTTRGMVRFMFTSSKQLPSVTWGAS